MRIVPKMASLFALVLACFASSLVAQDERPAEEATAEDLKLLQGKWELMHGNDGSGGPSIYSVKEIAGNRETLRRYDVQSGKKIREHAVDFTLGTSGDVRVFTFYAVGGDPKSGQSFIYKVDAENFYDVSGLLQGDTFSNYQSRPMIWHWKRIADPNAPEPRIVSPTPPREEIPAALRKDLESLGARIGTRPNGYGIDLRRKPGFNDAHLDLVVQCPQVVDLTLEGVSISNRGLEKLVACPQLARLILNDCAISAEGLEILAGLPLRESLISIGLSGTKVKEDDLQWLKDFTKLERVDVSRTAVSDASLPALEPLPLKVLTVTDTQISAGALEQLLLKHPQLVLKR
jgi:hypothetical protein